MSNQIFMSICDFIDVVLGSHPIECVICWDMISAATEICNIVCCNKFVHEKCMDQAMLHSTDKCPYCDHFAPRRISGKSSSIECLKKIANGTCLADSIESLFNDPKRARLIDYTIRDSLGNNLEYGKLFRGVYIPPAVCRFIGGRKTEIYDSPKQNVLCSLQTFKERLDEFTYGILSDFDFSTKCLLAGTMIPALLGARNYQFATQIPIHIVITADHRKLLENLILHIQKKIGDLTKVEFSINCNFVYIRIALISRLIKIEIATGYQNLYAMITNYSLGPLELCQACYYDNQVLLTTKSLVAFGYQQTFNAKIGSNELEQLKFIVSGGGTDPIPTLNLNSTTWSSSIDFDVLDSSVKFETILIAHIKSTTNLIWIRSITKMFKHIQDTMGIPTQIINDPAITENCYFLQRGHIKIVFPHKLCTLSTLEQFVLKNLS